MMRFFQIICWVILLTLSIPAIGQRSDFDWRIGISGGYSNYYGDLSPYTIRGLSNGKALGQLFEYNPNYAVRPSFKVTLERALSPTVGFSLAYGQYTFGSSDRFIRKDGTIWIEAPNFSRGLNFQNQSRSYGLGLVFKANNGKLLPVNSWISPYFNVGVGFLDFEVKGDLLNERGQRYNYNSVRSIHDGIYETNLAEVQTEGKYPLHAFYSNFGLGFSIRVTKRFELFAESDLMFTFSDNLDDVSGKYRGDYANDFQEYAANPSSVLVIPDQTWRGNPNELNDWVIYHSVGLKYNLGVSKRTFKAPRISTFLPSYSSTKKKGSIELAEQEQSTSDSVLIRRMSQLELIQNDEKLRVDSIIQKLLSVDLEQASSKRENYLRAIENRKNPMISSEISDDFIDNEEIIRVKAENQKLRLLLNQALLEQEEAKIKEPIQTDQRQTIIRETIQVQPGETKRTDNRTERSKDQVEEKLLLSGGAFGVGAAIGNRNAGNSTSQASRDSLFTPSKGADSVSLDSSLKANKSFDLNLQKLNLSPELQSLKVTDTVYLSKEGEVRLLPGKTSLYFDINQKVPNETELLKLEDLVEFFQSQENLHFVLSGFADNTGSLTYNLKLAEERMSSVSKILQTLYEIPENRIHLESGGQVIRGTKKLSSEQDRRVEVRVQTTVPDF